MSDQPPAYGQPYYPPMPPRFDVGQAFAWAWAKFKANAATLIMSTLVVVLAFALAYAVAVVVAAAVVPDATFFLRSDPETGSLEGLGSYAATLGITYAVLFVASIPLSVLGAGLVGLGLRIADGQRVVFTDLFRVSHPARIMLATTIVALGSLVGLVLCYLPGLAFGLFAAFTTFFVLDREQRPVEALKSSFALVKNNFGNALGSQLLAGLAAAGGVVACFVGVLVTAPIALLVHVYTYRVLSGGTVAP
jgi:uncharacterized membrane protein